MNSEKSPLYERQTMTSKELAAEAERLRLAADAKFKEANTRRIEELRELPVAGRLVYAAFARCPCGAGMAYDHYVVAAGYGFAGGGGYWDCSAILLGTADKAVKHTDKLPFSFWDIKEEGQPSACGATTRPSA